MRRLRHNHQHYSRLREKRLKLFGRDKSRPKEDGKGRRASKQIRAAFPSPFCHGKLDGQLIGVFA
jgi:hypothetical protein